MPCTTQCRTQRKGTARSFCTQWPVPLCREDTDAVRKQVVDDVGRALDAATEPEIADEAGAMLISRSWLRQWKLKQCRLSHLTDAAVSPTQSITCLHERLLPENIKRCASAAPRGRGAARTACVGAMQGALVWKRHACGAALPK